MDLDKTVRSCELCKAYIEIDITERKIALKNTEVQPKIQKFFNPKLAAYWTLGQKISN